MFVSMLMILALTIYTKCSILSHNQLKTLPQTIGQLHNLQTLHVEHNQLREMTPEICRLIVLEDLVSKIT